jgi:hypothetical protein
MTRVTWRETGHPVRLWAGGSRRCAVSWAHGPCGPPSRALQSRSRSSNPWSEVVDASPPAPRNGYIRRQKAPAGAVRIWMTAATSSVRRSDKGKPPRSERRKRDDLPRIGSTTNARSHPGDARSVVVSSRRVRRPARKGRQPRAPHGCAVRRLSLLADGRRATTQPPGPDRDDPDVDRPGEGGRLDDELFREAPSGASAGATGQGKAAPRPPGTRGDTTPGDFSDIDPAAGRTVLARLVQLFQCRGDPQSQLFVGNVTAGRKLIGKQPHLNGQAGRIGGPRLPNRLVEIREPLPSRVIIRKQSGIQRRTDLLPLAPEIVQVARQGRSSPPSSRLPAQSNGSGDQ